MVIYCLFWVVRFIWDRRLWLVQNYGCRRGLSENSELVKQAEVKLSQAQPRLKLMLRLNFIFIMTVGLSKWWKFRTLIKLNYSDKNSSHWWKTITLRKTNHSKKSSLRWTFITLMRIHHLNENSSMLCHIIIMLTIHSSCENLFLGKNYHSN